MCSDVQAEYRTVERWSRSHDEAVAITGPLTDGVTVDVGDVRPRGISTPRSYVVDVRLIRGDEIRLEHLLVVAEQGGYRACGEA